MKEDVWAYRLGQKVVSQKEHLERKKERLPKQEKNWRGGSPNVGHVG